MATRLMPQVGISAESALALQLMTYFVQVGVSLVGGVIFVVLFLQGPAAALERAVWLRELGPKARVRPSEPVLSPGGALC